MSVRAVGRAVLGLTVLYALASLAALGFSDQLRAVVRATPPAVVAQFLAMITFAFALRAAKWCWLARCMEIGGGWRLAAAVYVGGFPMTLTPGRVGEMWRAWALNRRAGVTYRRALPLVVCDRLVDLNALLLFAALGVFSAALAYRLPALLALTLLLPVLVGLLHPRWCRWAVGVAWVMVGRRAVRGFASLRAVFRNLALAARPAVYAPALVLAILAWGVEAAAIWQAARALGGALSLVGAMSVLGLGNIAGVLSFLPGGIGGQEAVMIALLREGGSSLAAAVVVTGIARVCTVFYAALLGAPFFVRISRLSRMGAEK